MKLHVKIQPLLSPHDRQVVGEGEPVQGCSSPGLHIQVGVLQGVGVHSDGEARIEVFHIVGFHNGVVHSVAFHNGVFHSEGLVVLDDGNVVGLVGVWWEVKVGSALHILHLHCIHHRCSHGHGVSEVGALNGGEELACGDVSCAKFCKLFRFVIFQIDIL